MKQWILIAIGLLVSATSYAQLIVVNTDGPTVSAAPYLNDIHYPKKGDSSTLLQMNRSFFQEKEIHLQKIMYPATSRLTPGKIKSHPIKTKDLTRPIFVIGDNSTSIRWAKTNASELKHIGAIGIITNVTNQARTQQIEQETGLTLLPVDLSGISQYLQVSHYPFLWTKSDVEQ